MKRVLFSSVAFIFLLLCITVIYRYSSSLNLKKTELSNGAHFEVTDCWFEAPSFHDDYKPYAWLFGFKMQRVECGYMTTREEQGESFFSLPVVVYRHSFWRKSKYPVINISGGPGAPAWLDKDSIENIWLPSISDDDWQHDIVLYDSRGTGRSEPALHCDLFFQDTLALLSKNLQPEEEANLGYQSLLNCHQELSRDKKKIKALHHLGTLRNADDIADLAHLLNVDAWHLYGTSYGTRLALEVARQHSDTVKTLILDSVYPQEIDGEETMPDLYLDAVEGMLNACSDNLKCAFEYSNLQKKLHIILQRLQNNPITLSLEHNNKPVDLVLTPSRFFSLLYDTGYSIHTVIAVPNVIDSLYKGNLDTVHFLAQNSLDMMLDKSFSNPVFMEVECNENEVKNQQTYINNINKKYQHYPVLKRWQLSAIKNDLCDVWGSKEIDDSFHQPVITDKPTLILTGQLDSATPPEWGRMVASRLPNSEYHEFKASGHAVLYNVACSKNIVRRFLNPDKNYPAACQLNDPYDNGQQVVWHSPDMGTI